MSFAAATPLLQVAAADQRAGLERFIARRFSDVYGARVSHYCAHLLGVRSSDGAWLAAAGFTPAASQTLYLEQYLDRPIEETLKQAAGIAVARAQVVEVGNLAAAPGAGRMLIPALCACLDALGYRWVAFTATRQLRNALRRLRLEPLLLAPAEPARLADGGAAWGTYYRHAPRVMGGRLGFCLEPR